MALYEDILPEDARITASAVDGAILRVQYRSASGPGSVTCDLAQDGTVDFTPTMNRKIDWVWDHPEIKPRLRPLSDQFGIGQD